MKDSDASLRDRQYHGSMMTQVFLLRPFSILRPQPRLRPATDSLRRTAVAALICACLHGPQTQAWGPLGHELAGTISEDYLSAQTRNRIKDILGHDDLAKASTWADRMRSNPSDFWQREAGPLHYVDVRPGTAIERRRVSRRGDALLALADFREQLLSDGTTREQQALALRFAIHIVQDLHQPLHVGNGKDRGGNSIKLKVHGKNSNLHRLWDSQVLYSAGRSQRQWLTYFRDSKILRAPVTEDADPLAWMEESIALRDTLYPAPKKIDDAYMRRQLPRAEIRVALAGIRTAAWLNATLDPRANRRTDANGSQPEPAEKTWWGRFLDLFP